jgi:hypothetical protein
MKKIAKLSMIELTNTYTLHQFVNYYDVWGNKVDGFEVNNLCYEPVFILTKSGEFPTMQDVIKILKIKKFLNPQLKSKSFSETYPYDSMFEIQYNHPEKGYIPVGRFEEIDYNYDLPKYGKLLDESQDFFEYNKNRIYHRN